MGLTINKKEKIFRGTKKQHQKIGHDFVKV